jgi:hypothetical protein
LCILKYAARNLEGVSVLPEKLYRRHSDNFYDILEMKHALPGILIDLLCIEIDRQSLCMEFRSEIIHWEAYARIKYVVVPAPDRDCRLINASWRCVVARDDREEERREHARWKRKCLRCRQKILASTGPYLTEARKRLHAKMRLELRENVAICCWKEINIGEEAKVE